MSNEAPRKFFTDAMQPGAWPKVIGKLRLCEALLFSLSHGAFARGAASCRPWMPPLRKSCSMHASSIEIVRRHTSEPKPCNKVTSMELPDFVCLTNVAGGIVASHQKELQYLPLRFVSCARFSFRAFFVRFRSCGLGGHCPYSSVNVSLRDGT